MKETYNTWIIKHGKEILATKTYKWPHTQNELRYYAVCFMCRCYVNTRGLYIEYENK